jgi:hypothetical protein
MIYFCQVDTDREDALKQVEILERSFNSVGQSGKLVIVKTGNYKAKYQKLNLDLNYPVYKRHIALIEYIEKNNLFNEDIMILDPDMFFNKKFDVGIIKENKLYATQWIVNHIVDLEDLPGILQRLKDLKITSNNTSFIPFAAPYYGKGKLIYEISKIHLNIDRYLRSSHFIKNRWITEMYSLSIAPSVSGYETIYHNLSLYSNIHDANIQTYQSLPIIHYYSKLISLSSDPSSGRKWVFISKYDMGNYEKMKIAINGFHYPVDDYSKYMLPYYKEWFK